MADEIEATTRKILADTVELQTPVERIGLEDNLFNLGLDSMTCMKVIVAIEAEFNFEFNDSDLHVNNFRNLQNLVSYIEKRVAL